MPRKPSFLSVREYVKLTIDLIDFFEKYGDCPLLREELPKHRFIGKAILRKADAKRKTGNRKDLYVEAERKK